MMKSEFEALAKRTVTTIQYKAIETLYIECDLDKYEFVKMIKPLLKSIPEKRKNNRVSWCKGYAKRHLDDIRGRVGRCKHKDRKD